MSIRASYLTKPTTPGPCYYQTDLNHKNEHNHGYR